MVYIIKSAAISGIDSFIVDVEVDVSSGLPGFEMIGLLGVEVKEAKERVRVSLKNNGISIPACKITVNLSPADIRKDGTGYDLPIAAGILAGLGIIKNDRINNILIAGELGLDGEIKEIHGVLPMVLEAKEKGITACILPKNNCKEAAVVKGIKIIGVENLALFIDYINADDEERDLLIPPESINVEEIFDKGRFAYNVDFSDICGQDSVKRAMLIGAAGFHNVLMIGSPGAGKTMVAKRVPTIMPPLTMAESLDVSKIYSVCGLLDNECNIVTRRPFMHPHHTVSAVALAGGGRVPKPGIISRAHKGVLFLDEAVHFSTTALEILRQPMEDKEIQIGRTNGSFTFPADFMLVAAINPCPCGNYPDANECTCTPEQIRKYLGRLSGPILDRIDICVETPKISVAELNGQKSKVNSQELREKVLMAVELQKKRFEGTSITFNSQMEARDIDRFIELGIKERELMEKIYEKMKLSARGYHRVLKVARTIADLDGEKCINQKHLLEAVSYRSLEDKYWGRQV